jgi:hypothetical protein
MKVTVANWVHRTIRRQERFVDARDDRAIREAYPEFGEAFIGVYRNPPGAEPEEVIITNAALVLRHGDELTQVPFAQMVGIRGPEKATDGQIQLELRDGAQVDVVVGGRQGKFEDVFGFMRFLKRVTTKTEGE